MPINLFTFDPQPIAAAVPDLHIGLRLGHGGQKAVWICTYQGKDYVLKVMIADPDSTERARRELEVYRRCSSRYLPTVGPLPLTQLQIGGDEVLYYLEQFIDGLPLSDVTPPMPPADVLRLGYCGLDAITELSKNGFVHRDVKPANIVKRPNGEYVFLDAGIALDAAGPSLTGTGGIVGTHGYRSPDQLQLNKRDLDFRSDLFLLGITMYQYLTGQHPFWNAELPAGDVHHNIVNQNCPAPQRWNPALPDLLCDVIMRLLDRDRHLRYARVEHMRDDLDRIVIS
jgi:serine/threonine protein kinase